MHFHNPTRPTNSFWKQSLTIIILALFLCINDAPAQSLWSKAKEKAKSAWNSDTRKNAWSKTKETAKSAWNSDTRKKAWKKTKDTAKKAWNSDTRKNASEKLSKADAAFLDSHRYTVPLTERRFINVIPDNYLLSMSESQYRSTLSKSRLSTNANRKARVERVSKRLIKAVEKFYRNQDMEEELENFDWEITLVKSDVVNASCLPGGKIIVYDGILDVANNDDALAIVIGHEIAHAIAKHSAEQMTKGIMSAASIAAICVMINCSDMSEGKKTLAKLMASAGVTLANLKFSRVDEAEADRIGMILAAMAGYNPEQAVPFWKRMGEKSSNKSTHDWYSTHPSNSNRIANIKSYLPEAKRYYKK